MEGRTPLQKCQSTVIASQFEIQIQNKIASSDDGVMDFLKNVIRYKP